MPILVSIALPGEGGGVGERSSRGETAAGRNPHGTSGSSAERPSPSGSGKLP